MLKSMGIHFNIKLYARVIILAKIISIWKG